MKLKKLLLTVACLSPIAASAFQITCPEILQLAATTCSGNTASYRSLASTPNNVFLFTSEKCTTAPQKFLTAELFPIEKGFYLHCTYAVDNQSVTYINTVIVGPDIHQCSINGNLPYHKCSGQEDPANCNVVCE